MGLIAVMLATSDRLVEAAFFVFLGIIFDFFDGFAARLLKVQSNLGVQLDSLADMVTSGVVPGVVMFQLLNRSLALQTGGYSWDVSDWIKIESADTGFMHWEVIRFNLIPFLGLLLTLAAAYRLAKFNLDSRQKEHFIGLPTPAMALFILSLPLILTFHTGSEFILNTYFLAAVTLFLSILMNINLPLFSLKFKKFNFADNWLQITFMAISILLIIFLKLVALPVIILLYIVLSIVYNFLSPKKV